MRSYAPVPIGIDDKAGNRADGPLWPTIVSLARQECRRVTLESERTSDRLDSWKEIAAYLRRGVRTVRRWEHEEGLPVHRHVHRVLGSVYAFKSEIDGWQRAQREQRDRPVLREAIESATGNAASRMPSIAVLPFANLSADPENAYFADGLTDEITADLCALRSLRVISRTSSGTFKGSTKDAKTIARELGARYLLEGSVRRVNDRLRVTAQLIDAHADAHLWAEKFDGTWRTCSRFKNASHG